MTRSLSLVAALALVLAWCATADAAGKKKKAAKSGTVVGTITAVSEDGKSFTVTSPGRKKQTTTTEIKVTPTTKIHYVGIQDKAEQKLVFGYAVLVALEEQGSNASVIAVAKAPETKKKKVK
jgi:hypothetical protein